MITFTRPSTPTGYSDEDGNWISRAEWIARYVLPTVKPAQRKMILAMADGFIYVCGGKGRKVFLQRGDEVLPVRAALPEGIQESAGETKTRGPADMMGHRKVYTTYKTRLNQDAIVALKALGWVQV